MRHRVHARNPSTAAPSILCSWCRRGSEFLAEQGYDPAFGARPLKRTIQRELQDPLALKILAGEFREGDVIEVDSGTDGLVFTTAVRGEVVEV